MHHGSTFPRLAVLLVLLALASNSVVAARLQLAAFARRHESAASDRSVTTFVVREGKFSWGETEGTDLKSVPFDEVANDIAAALSKPNFVRIEDSEAADWRIVIHRGRTRGGTQALNPPDPLNSGTPEIISVPIPPQHGTYHIRKATDPGHSVYYRSIPLRSSRVAATLGFRDLFETQEHELNHPAVEERIRRLFRELSKDRYYIIVAAYDWSAMKRDHDRGLLWETRLSVDAADLAFADCYRAMIEGGARYLGGTTRGRLVRRSVRLP
ncbi:hypothetical protein [Synoicihabitans lomoniglobus]|uniref:Uncharacterized protein n=1 Tax=Synoicihabitans lomoniglobus TaxID=2909285 RepID=A0AAF0CT42_9BACT|nr:hypothetical protein [Opitutaceae bacterium LMO-M01]WED67496.1 hypothetical protein PXH66_11605 [Opitutaceae bacterium LMO-M01]